MIGWVITVNPKGKISDDHYSYYVGEHLIPWKIVVLCVREEQTINQHVSVWGLNNYISPRLEGQVMNNF